MLTNFLLAIALMAITIGLLIGLDFATSFMAQLTKRLLKIVRRSKLLTEYILRAYMRYRKAIHKPLVSNR